MDVRWQFVVKNRSLAMVWLALAAMACLGGCTHLPDLPTVDGNEKASLLSGELIFGEPVPAATSIDILEPSAAMRSFLAPIAALRKPSDRLRVLVETLARDGYLNAQYEEQLTQDAATTFASRTGNCLSYTNLFVALAREVGLDARYQRVDVPARWDVDDRLLIRSNHVNVMVRGVRFGPENLRFVMDFNYVEPNPDYKRWVVSDAHAFALMYANLSVQALRGNDLRRAFAFQKRAIEVDPENMDHWVNVGVIYATAGLTDAAENAFSVAIQGTWRRESALAGLAALYRQTGQLDAAARLQTTVERYRERNPFYHLAVGQSAYDAGHFDAALISFDRAIARQARTGIFHFMRALTLYRLGDFKRAERGLGLAQYFGVADELTRDYRDDLAVVLADVSLDTPGLAYRGGAVGTRIRPAQ